MRRLAPDVWTQLWTPTQTAAQIKNCVYQGSGGLLEFQAAPLADQAGGLSYVGRLLDSCIAAYPVDGRLWLVPEKDGGAWDAYDLVVVKNRAEWYALSDACPALPPDIAADVRAAGAPG